MSRRIPIHLVPRGDGWALKREGGSRASETFTHKSDAYDRGRDMAAREGGQLVVHRGDGTIQAEHTYGPDPFPPRG